jgi:hypothetical protein
MHWQGSDNKTSSSKNPIILKQFESNKHAVQYDNTLGKAVVVETHQGVPFCKTCDTDDSIRNTKMMVPYRTDCLFIT